MSDKPQRNFYVFLDLSPSASESEIKQAIRKRLRENHPDRFPGDQLKLEITRLCNDATRWLTTSLRTEHDRIYLQQEYSGSYKQDQNSKSSSGGASWHGPNPGRPEGERKKYRTRGEDVLASTSITFAEAYLGCIKEVSGTKFRIPSGIRDGKLVRVAGKGLKSPDGGAAGDLFITISVETNKVFSYHASSKDLCITVPVTELEALLGIELRAYYFDGTLFSISIPSDSHAKKLWKIENKNGAQANGLPSTYWIKLATTKVSPRAQESLDSETRALFQKLNSTIFPDHVRGSGFFPRD